MNAPHLAFLVLTFRQVRYRTFYDMEAVFEDAGRLRDEARFWPGSYFIPQEALPAWLSDAQAAGGQRRALSRLLCALGPAGGGGGMSARARLVPLLMCLLLALPAARDGARRGGGGRGGPRRRRARPRPT